MEGSAPAVLNTLTDVTITTPASGQFLKWNGSAFVNFTPTLQDLSNVASGTPNNLDILQYNAGSGEYEPTSRYAYDSGWTSTLEGTALAANQAMTVLISPDVYDTLIWREVKFYGRDSGSPDTFYPIQDSYLIEETAGGTQFSVGIKWNATYLNPLYYITLTTGDYAYASTDAPTILNWVTTIDQIRVVIT